MVTILKSKEDNSVNFVQKFHTGIIESRFVQRVPDYFIAYLSSHNGCKYACRMCHLTQTGQTLFIPLSNTVILQQAKQIIEYWKTLKNVAKKVHFNFMARGELLANPDWILKSNKLISNLESLAFENNLDYRINISTIMPKDLDTYILPITSKVKFYYSLYTMDQNYRKKWLPNALSIQEALHIFKNYQQLTNNEIVLHWAFIKDVNDKENTVWDIINYIKELDLRVKFNLVRYNPFNDSSEESSEEVIQRNFNILKTAFKNSKIIPKVGFDVKASCGMFV